MRSDHLKSVLIFALRQAESGIAVLDFGSNTNALKGTEHKAEIKSMLDYVKKVTQDGDMDLVLLPMYDDTQMEEIKWKK